jgi:hypothetical protein
MIDHRTRRPSAAEIAAMQRRVALQQLDDERYAVLLDGKSTRLTATRDSTGIFGWSITSPPPERVSYSTGGRGLADAKRSAATILLDTPAARTERRSWSAAEWEAHQARVSLRRTRVQPGQWQVLLDGTPTQLQIDRDDHFYTRVKQPIWVVSAPGWRDSDKSSGRSLEKARIEAAWRLAGEPRLPEEIGCEWWQ